MSSHLPAYTNQDIKEFLIRHGASGTIYAFAFPESRAVLEETIDGGVRTSLIEDALAGVFAQSAAPSQQAILQAITATLGHARSEYTGIYEAAWTSRQDSVDKHFFNAWKKWSAPVVTLPEGLQKFSYPTIGASEGLREAINQHAIKSLKKEHSPTIHVFEGEYEGFRAYAEAAGIHVFLHNRHTWRSSIDQIMEGEQFYISQPSAIDGNVWEEFDDFAKALHEQCPAADIMLDLTYVGSVAKDFKINAGHPNIAVAFFSLSKPFGVYYHRIGGMFSREEYPSLMGNKWFKNLQSLQYGTALLERSTVYDLPRKYKATQEAAMEAISARLNIPLKASDVILFGTADCTDPQDKIQKSLLRGPAGQQFIRLCVTPEMARMTPGAVFMEMGKSPILPPAAIRGPRLGV